jgi:site-specific recombinase XerC
MSLGLIYQVSAPFHSELLTRFQGLATLEDYEAADSGLLSPELAAGIRRVKGVKHLGQRSGNWLNIDQAKLLVDKSDGDGLRNKRDFAMISNFLGCGLRRAELAALNIDDIQIRQGHWVIVDLIGKCGHVRTVPMPA